MSLNTNTSTTTTPKKVRAPSRRALFTAPRLNAAAKKCNNNEFVETKTIPKLMMNYRRNNANSKLDDETENDDAQKEVLRGALLSTVGAGGASRRSASVAGSSSACVCAHQAHDQQSRQKQPAPIGAPQTPKSSRSASALAKTMRAGGKTRESPPARALGAPPRTTSSFGSSASAGRNAHSQGKKLNVQELFRASTSGAVTPPASAKSPSSHLASFVTPTQSGAAKTIVHARHSLRRQQSASATVGGGGARQRVAAASILAATASAHRRFTPPLNKEISSPIFAASKFSESPSAKALPLPPSDWILEAEAHHNRCHATISEAALEEDEQLATRMAPMRPSFFLNNTPPSDNEEVNGSRRGLIVANGVYCRRLYDDDGDDDDDDDYDKKQVNGSRRDLIADVNGVYHHSYDDDDDSSENDDNEDDAKSMASTSASSGVVFDMDAVNNQAMTISTRCDARSSPAIGTDSGFNRGAALAESSAESVDSGEGSSISSSPDNDECESVARHALGGEANASLLSPNSTLAGIRINPLSLIAVLSAPSMA